MRIAPGAVSAFPVSAIVARVGAIGADVTGGQPDVTRTALGTAAAGQAAGLATSACPRGLRDRHRADARPVRLAGHALVCPLSPVDRRTARARPLPIQHPLRVAAGFGSRTLRRDEARIGHADAQTAANFHAFQPGGRLYSQVGADVSGLPISNGFDDDFANGWVHLRASTDATPRDRRQLARYAALMTGPA
jgi:hypothetical protein